MSKNLSASRKAAEKEGRFCQNGLVGVQWYGRERFGKKLKNPDKIGIFLHLLLFVLHRLFFDNRIFSIK